VKLAATQADRRERFLQGFWGASCLKLSPKWKKPKTRKEGRNHQEVPQPGAENPRRGVDGGTSAFFMGVGVSFGERNGMTTWLGKGYTRKENRTDKRKPKKVGPHGRIKIKGLGSMEHRHQWVFLQAGTVGQAESCIGGPKGKEIQTAITRKST